MPQRKVRQLRYDTVLHWRRMQPWSKLYYFSACSSPTSDVIVATASVIFYFYLQVTALVLSNYEEPNCASPASTCCRREWLNSSKRVYLIRECKLPEVDQSLLRRWSFSLNNAVIQDAENVSETIGLDITKLTNSSCLTSANSKHAVS